MFELIKDKIHSLLRQIPTNDLSLESLTALIAIMLAQAQEAFCLKAIQGIIKKMKTFTCSCMLVEEIV